MERFGIVFVYLDYIMAIWYILWPFGKLVAIWYIPPFWYIVSRKIWQPCTKIQREERGKYVSAIYKSPFN
jgi:hypothetical protein